MYAIAASSLALIVSIATAPAVSQKTVTKKGETITAVETIQAIDQTSRMVTLRADDGTEEMIYVPASVKRFNELKVGDKVKAKYYESYVFQIRKAGDAAPPKTEGTTGAITRNKGGAPGMTLSTQQTATVEVVSVDKTAGSITVKTSDGRTIIRKVDNKKNLEGVSTGDKIDITYTQAALISVEPAK
jgi:hypothetical protein